MKFIIASAAVALLSTTAFAADAVFTYASAPNAVAQVPAYAWTGAYIGVNAGYGGGKAKSYYIDFEDPEYGGIVSITGSGFVGGAQAGYNWQSGSFVYGAETDIQYSSIKASIGEEWNGTSGEAGLKVKWFGTTRARLGYVPTERVLAYATGGVAYGEMEIFGNTNKTLSKSQVGWAAGAGVEYAIDNNWSLKTEYLYTDLGKWTVDADLYSEEKIALKFHTIRAGLNYKF